MPLAYLLRMVQLVKVALRLGGLGLNGALALKCSADCIYACPQACHSFYMI